MNDDLTLRIRAAGNNTTVTPPPPALVRASAERRRRNRRWGGGVLVAVIAVLAGTSVLVQDLRPPQTVPPVAPPASAEVLPPRTSPVEPLHYELMFIRDENVVLVLESSVPSDRPHVRLQVALETAIPLEHGRCPEGTGNCRTATPEQRMNDLAADPMLTRDDLAYFGQLSPYAPLWRALPEGVAVPTLTTCFPGPAGLGAAKAHVAGFVADSRTRPVSDDSKEARKILGPGYLIETVLQFDDQTTAANAYRTIRHRALSCDYSAIEPFVDGGSPDPNWSVDEHFIADFEPPA
ncbi:hypothetical protein ACVBEQ_26420 [Nakamurella sp. GG22]